MKKLPLALMALTTLLSPMSYGGTFTVNTTADTHSVGFTSQDAPGSTAETDVNGNISLRSALERASTLGGSTTIVLPAGVYNLSLGDLVVGVQAGTMITVQGAGPVLTTIHQTQTHLLVFVVNYNVSANVVFTLQNVTVSGGNEDSFDPDGFGGNGGAILAGGSSSAPGNALTLDSVVFSGNSTTGNADGGAIAMSGGGDLTVANCSFSANNAGLTGTGVGGAIYFDASFNPGNVSIDNSSFANNGATGASAGQGGAVYLAGGDGNTYTINQCTFAGNSAGQRGGAIDLESGLLTANFNRFSGNSAPTASGMFVLSGSGAGSADVRNNWWGANGGPNGLGSDSCVPSVNTTPPLGAGQIAFDPWLQLTHTATPNPVTVANSTTLTASFLVNSAGTSIPAANLGVLLGLPVTFNAPVLGSLSGAQSTIQVNGTATATFNAGTSPGTGHANALVDNAVATASFTIQPGPATHFTLSAPATATAGTPFTVTVTALDQFNNTATGYRGTVHFTKSDSGTGAAVPADYTFVAGDNGVHTFSNGTTLVTVGSQSVTATDTSGSISGSAGVSVSAAAASHFVLSGPANVVAGNAFNVTVTAEDAFNNTATGYRGTVHLSSSDAQAVLPGDFTFSAGDNGAHAISATLKTVGNQTLTATDTATPTITGTSAAIFICSPTIFVDGVNGNDTNPGTSPTQAKQTIQAAIDIACAGSTVQVSAGTYTPAASLLVDKDLNIVGAGAGTTIVSGSANGGSSVFTINSGGANPGPTVLLSSLTVAGATTSSGNGGGIYNNTDSSLTVMNCTIAGNQSGGDFGGGGIFNLGTLTVGNSTISTNQATAATGSGGAIFSTGTLTVTNSTLAGNQALGSGGGIVVSNGLMTVANSTLSGNAAGGDGGGLALASGTMMVADTTITGNRGTNSSGGVFAAGTATLDNTIVAGNFTGSAATPGDIAGGTVSAAANNLIGDAATAGGIVNGVNGNIVGSSGSGTIDVTTVLNPTLANNGGPTLTHALVPGSPALDAGGVLNEVQEITVVGSSGTFTLTFNGQTTTALAFNATATQVQSALNALSTIGGLGGSVSITANAGVYTTTFGGTLANADQAQLLAAGAGGATVTVATLQDGLAATDQRGPGFQRLFNGAVDIGAYELSPDLAPTGGFTVLGTEGVTGAAQTVATFTDRLGPDLVANYSALVDWGDGAPATAGTITLAGSTFSVQGSHTYLEEGTFTVTITITHLTTPTVTTTSTAIISDPPVTATGGFAITGAIGVQLSSQTLATFTDPAGPEPLADYSAMVDWGDGAPPTPGTITLAGSTFSVTGVHTYALNGSFVIAVTISHDSAPNSSVSSTATITGATLTGLTASPSPSVFGQPVTLTATVSPAPPAAGTPTGTVTFLDGPTTLGTATLNGAGQATLITSTLAVGNHTLTAVYSGDLDFTPSTSSTFSQFVDLAASATVATTAPNPSVFGQPVTLTATVLPIPPGAGLPTGSVTFFDAATPLGTVPLNPGGQASLVVTALATGSHPLNAAYSGDSDFKPSSASPGSQLVTQAATTTALVSSVNPSGLGQSVTFTATVGPVAPGAGTPTGNVTFTLDGSPAATVPLDVNGRATFTTSSLTLATHTLSAAYSGDANDTPSTSATLSQVVNQVATTMTVGSSANPSLFGQAVTFTATVSSSPAGSGTPSGSVTFTLNGTPVATVALNVNGVASYTASGLPVGVTYLAVVYPGGPSFGGSSVTLAQTVSCVSPIYVDGAAGNDANTGVSPAQAKQTIQAAIDAACAGGKVLLEAGIYQPTASLQVNKDLTFVGDGAATTIINGSANGGQSVFVISGDTNSGPTVLLSGLSIQEAGAGGNGGAVFNDAGSTLTVSNCTLAGNNAGSGGAIFNAGALTLNQSMISSNTASAANSGGALYNQGTLTVNLCTLNANSGSTNSGGALYSSGTATINESTLSGNSAQSGGGAIFSTSAGSLFVNQSTVSGNAAVASTGGIAGDNVSLKNTIVAGNNGGDLSGTLAPDSAGNLVGLPAGITTISQILNPALANNGGPTLTLALVAGSPAIGAGNTNLVPPDLLDLNGNGNLTEPLPYDQRGPGHPRLAAGTVDIGAFEFPDTVPPTVAIGNPSAAITAGGPVTYTVTYSDPNFLSSTLAVADITLNHTGTAQGTVAVSGSGNTLTITISTITGDGTLGLSLAAGTASDTFGNLAPAAGPSATFQVDNTPPSVAISAPSVSTTASGPVTYTVTYTDANFGSSTLSASNVTLNATETAAGVIAVTGTDNVQTVTISNITGHGTLGIAVAAATAVDLAGNLAPAAGPSATFIVNHPPIAGPVTVSRNPSQGITIPVSLLLTNDTDADGDVLSITAVQAPSSGQATVTLAADQVVYTPNPGFTGPDTFTYTVSDTRGGLATGTVTVNVTGTVPGQLAILYLGGNAVRISITANPSATFIVQSTGSLNAPNWQTLRTITTDAQGAFSFDDTVSTASRFYRLLAP